MLPTDDEVTAAVGNGLSSFDFQPVVGGPEILPDGFRTDADAAPIGCIGVTDTSPRVVYERTPLLEAARQSYFTLAEVAAYSGADAAVLRMASPDAAQAVFSDAVRRWQQCDGTTVTKHVGGTANAEVLVDIRTVSRDDSMLSATLLVSQQSLGGSTSRYQRALGVRGDTLVEVSLAVTPAGTRNDQPRAVAVARAMLDKVGRS